MRQISAVLRRMMDTSAYLSDLVSNDEVDHAAESLIESVIAADEVLWTHIDLGDTSATVRTGPDLAELSPLSADLARTAHAHPAIASYLAPGDDRRPRRVSDVTDLTSWMNSPAYLEPFSNRSGRFQLSLVTHLEGATGTGWVLTRSVSDFTDDDVETATLLLPFLTALTVLGRSRPLSSCSSREPLTAREGIVLALLAEGLTAATIGRRLEITEGTVRKHLNHVYAKLGVHDRLGAVLTGAADGSPAAARRRRSGPASRTSLATCEARLTSTGPEMAMPVPLYVSHSSN